MTENLFTVTIGGLRTLLQRKRLPQPPLRPSVRTSLSSAFAASPFVPARKILYAVLYPFLFVLLLLPLAGCGNDAEDFYAHERAFLRFTPVTAAHPLFAAVNNPGIFCQITYDATLYRFLGNDGAAATYPATALQAYGRPESVAGFVVGIPSVPDMNMQQQPVAYDLVCPTCYELNMVQRSLVFSGTEELACPRCGCVYSLATGTLREGKSDARRLLYRYHVTYNSGHDMLLIMN